MFKGCELGLVTQSMSFGREDRELSFSHVCQEVAPLKDGGLYWSDMSQMLLLWKASVVLRFILGYQFRPCWKSRTISLWQPGVQNDQLLIGSVYTLWIFWLFFNQNKVRFSNVSLLIILSVTQLRYQGSPFSHTGTSSFHLQLLSIFLMKEMISSHYIIHKHGKMSFWILSFRFLDNYLIYIYFLKV